MTERPRQDADLGWWRELHGTRARYRKGCRCDSCRRAERDYRAEYRRRHRRESVTFVTLDFPLPPRSVDVNVAERYL